MKEPWYWSIIGEKFAPANCTLQDLKALDDRDRRIRFHVLSIGLRLFPVIDDVLAGSADQGRFTIIRGENGMPWDIDGYRGKNRKFTPSEVFAEIIMKARPKFSDEKTILRCLRSRQTDEIDALVEVIKRERARAKPNDKKKILDYLTGNNAGDIVASAKIVKKAMGKINDEKSVVRYLRSSNAEQIAALVKTMPASRPKPQDPTRNAFHDYVDTEGPRGGSNICLIMHKQTPAMSAADLSAVAELVNSCDAYRPGLEALGFTLESLLITNPPFGEALRPPLSSQWDC